MEGLACSALRYCCWLPLIRPVRLFGALLVLGMFGYIYLAYRQRESAAPTARASTRRSPWRNSILVFPSTGPGEILAAPIAFFLLGLVLIVAGGSLLVDAAIEISTRLGVSDEIIGLTVVAVGTSLPELVTSTLAALKRQGEIALGNVLGSNIYNILFIGGMTGIVSPTAIPAGILQFDLGVLIGVSALVMVLGIPAAG